MKLHVNGQTHEVDAPADMPLLWVLRDLLGLTGTKFGCGMAQCGACTVHLDGAAGALVRDAGRRRSAGKQGHDDRRPRRTTARIRCSARGSRPTSCSAATASPGQIMAAAALLEQKPEPTDADIDAAMAGNICRCGTYQRIREAVHRAARARRRRAAMWRDRDERAPRAARASSRPRRDARRRRSSIAFFVPTAMRRALRRDAPAAPKPPVVAERVPADRAGRHA